MIVSFRQSGVLAGPVKAIDLDTDLLDEPQRHELEQLVAASGIEHANGSSSSIARDWLQYEIVFEWENQSAAFSCDDKAVPASVQPLLQYLKQRAQPFP
jgi:hypothetical protein